MSLDSIVSLVCFCFSVMIVEPFVVSPEVWWSEILCC